MNSRSASDHGNPAGIAISMPKGTTSKGRGLIEILLSGKATVEEFRKLLGSTSYICLLVLSAFDIHRTVYLDIFL
jgi:hypothetical protein